jgi:hypothetical protein
MRFLIDANMPRSTAGGELYSRPNSLGLDLALVDRDDKSSNEDTAVSA